MESNGITCLSLGVRRIPVYLVCFAFHFLEDYKKNFLIFYCIHYFIIQVY